ncbi:hypothetical protein [Halobaculum sp. P14]|uniref:hypothetical protein n=1 Tax=Halobaculum sp. P14 TaxID=3421638 RepID=UPI003EBC91DD
MKLNRQTFLTLAAVFLVVVSSGVAAAASASYGTNPEADSHPDTKAVEDRLTIETHDRETMGWLEYEGDNGKIRQINAYVNGTESGAKVSYRADRIDAEALGMFPRVSGEENNSVTWLDTSNWTTSSGVSVSDTDGATATGVRSVKIASNGSFGASTTGSATFDKPAITSDAEKRYLQFVGNVDSLESGAEVAVQVRDGGGDYVEAVINSSRDATAQDVIANTTASGVVYQEQLGQLAVKGSGDGSLDAVTEVRVVVRGGDGAVTMTGLNVEKKSRWDFGEERVLDTSTDDSGDYKSSTVYSHTGGEINASSLQGLGETFSAATIGDLQYLNVEYRMQDDPAHSEIAFEKAGNYPNYKHKLVLSHRFTIPTAYDITHGEIVLKTRQSFLSDRYLRLRYAEGVGDTKDSEISSDAWIDLTGSLGEEGTWITVDSSVQPGTSYEFQLTTLLLDDQYKALQPTAGGGGGFWGSSSGGGNPFMSLYNWIAGGVVGLMTMLGLAKARGG